MDERAIATFQLIAPFTPCSVVLNRTNRLIVVPRRSTFIHVLAADNNKKKVTTTNKQKKMPIPMGHVIQLDVHWQTCRFPICTYFVCSSFFLLLFLLCWLWIKINRNENRFEQINSSRQNKPEMYKWFIY